MSRMYTTQDGLPTSDIYDIYVDSRGWAWVSGIASLSLFDGSNFYNLLDWNKAPIFNTVRGVREGHDGRMWIYTSNGLYNYDSSLNDFRHIFLSETEDSVRGMSVQAFIDYPKEGCRLVATDENGIMVFNQQTMEVDRETTDRLMAIYPDNMCTEACMDYDGCLWTMGTRLRRIDLKQMKLLEIAMTDEAAKVVGFHRVDDMILLKQSGNLLIATGGGLLIFDHETQMLRTLKGGHTNMPISVLKETHDGRVLVGSDSYGIWRMEADETLHTLNVYDPNTNLTFAKVKAIEEDAEGNLLFGLLQKGVMVMTRQPDNFAYYAISPTTNKINAVAVTSLSYDPKVGYIVSTDGCGVFRCSSSNLSESQQISGGLKSSLVQSTIIDRDGHVWVGTYGGGVQCLSGDVFITPSWLNSISNAYVMSLSYDAKTNTIYAGTNGLGVFIIDLQHQKYSNLRDRYSINRWISDLECDRQGIVWIGTAAGTFRYDPKTDEMSEVKFQDSGIKTAQCLSNMGDTTLVIATNNGLVLYNKQTKKYRTVLDDEFLRSVEVFGTDLWVTSQKEIICIDTRDDKIRRYSSFGGYFIGEFHGCSHLQTHDGQIFFGGDNGIISFNAKGIKQHKDLPGKLVFTRLLVNGRDRRYQPQLKNNALDASIQSATEIRLPSNENSIRIYYSVPDFASPNRIHYLYMMEGYDVVWKSTGSWSEAYYPNLPSGKYTLKIRAYYENNEDNYNENSIRIIIAQPWYNTVWAWIVYIVLLSLAAYFIYRIQHERSRQRNLLIKIRHNEQLKEAKLRMFTSITHELRSPLTMILSPLRQLQSSTDDEHLLSLYDVMQRNCERLLAVVKQITDIRKIDNGQFRLHYSEVEFASYSDYICSSFTAFASAKQITFTIEHKNQNVNIWIDKVHFEKILTNILSNAFKFTPKGGRIILRTKCILKDAKDWFEIRIYNSGSSIDAKDIPHIFERFYQANTPTNNAGSGIGLNLVNELVNLHHGTIEAHNIDPDGVEFVMQFPLGNSHLSEEELLPRQALETDKPEETDEDLFIMAEPEATNEEAEPTKSKYTVLLVDDDVELCQYIKSQMQEYYKIIIANSGNAAWQELLKLRPDAVVTDIRMPDGNGMELCKRIKSNPETDDIPIIMLTSENSDRAQIHSLNLQVDHFLSKPFNLLMLKGALSQCIRLREQIKSRIRRTEVGFDYSEATIDSADDQLFARVNSILKKNLDDSTFGVSELAEQAGISRVHLNRKMKERYGMSPVNFIRSYRLKQAAYFLVNNNVNISEVAYRVGFSSHSHFSNSFRDFFGMTPKEFITYYTENEDDETLQKLLE